MLAALVRRIFGRDSIRNDNLCAMIDRVVAATDPRLALLPSYRKVLMPSMQVSLTYIEQMAQTLPECLDLSLRAFTLDRRLGLFFSSPSSLLALLAKNPSLQEFFQHGANGDEAYAFLLMQRSDTLRFGVANNNGDLQSDVAQTVISFDRHRLLMPSPTLSALQQRSPERALDVLTRVIAARLSLFEQEYASLEMELKRVRLRISILGRPGSVLIDSMAESHPLPQSLDELQQMQDRLQQRMEEVKGVSDLTSLLELVAHMLAHPQDYLHFESCALNLDRMGILHDEKNAEEVTHLCMEEVFLGLDKPERRILMPVHVSRQSISELEHCVN